MKIEKISMNKQKFGVHIWFWVILAVVMVVALGTGGWYFVNQKGKTTVKTSPTPSQSAIISPSPSATTATPTSSKTKTPSGGHPQVETKTYEAVLPREGRKCSSKISFEYPKDYSVYIDGGTPMVGGARSLDIFKIGRDSNSNDELIYISSESYEHIYNYSPITCIDPPYSDLTAYFNNRKTNLNNSAKNTGTTVNISEPNSLTINGSPAFRWTEKGSLIANSPNTITAIQNTDKNVATISLYFVETSSAYDIIVNSFKFL